MRAIEAETGFFIQISSEAPSTVEKPGFLIICAQLRQKPGFLSKSLVKRRQPLKNPVSWVFVRSGLYPYNLTVSPWADNSRIQDTRHAIHPSRNKKPVSDETCRTYLSRASQCFNSKI
ncbi:MULTISPECIES: hypothetical protein [unclassified Microcoleus]|uniref:hypothetical protein n=1 Tax=unclassified Microcoleus TaxID=2642155 RepID=UPI002FD18FA4